MKIVHFRSNFDVGLGYDTLTLPLEQLKLGHDVCVITTDRASASNAGAGTLSKTDAKLLSVPSFEIQGLKVYRLPSYKLRYDDIVIPKGAAALLEQLKPDIVQATAAKEIMPAIAAKHKKRLGYSLFTREDQYDFPASTTLRRFLIKIEFLLWRRFWCDYTYNRCDGVLESSMTGIDFLNKYHHINKDIKIQYLLVCVDLKRFHPDEDNRKRIRKKHNLQESDKVLLCTGKVVPLKRFELLINAMANVPKEFNIQAWLVGGGDPAYIEKLKALSVSLGCSDRIFFMPNIPHEDLCAYYNAADMGYWNRSTSSIQEAMSCALPVIIPKYVTKVLPEYQAGQVFKDGDVQDLVYSISRLATDKTHHAMVSKRCLDKAKERFDVAKQAKELIALYQASKKK